MDHASHCAALQEEVGRFAGALAVADPGAAVPSCPGWSVAELAQHLGHVHRWAEHLVRVRAPERISASSMGLDNGPATPEWIRQGAAQLLTTLREVDPGTPMWAWGADQHARFWSRRQLHETLVHRMDLELATGTAPAASPDIATDAIDEFLANLAPAATFSPDVRKLRGHGQRLVFRTTDGETQRWTVTLLPGGFEVGTGAGPGDVELAAPSTTLLLVVYRRLALGSPGVTLTGASELVDFWVENSALT